MKGYIPKRIASAHLQCAKCVHFMDDDPDIYYCELDREEFASLCDQYEYINEKRVPSNRNYGCDY